MKNALVIAVVIVGMIGCTEDETPARNIADGIYYNSRYCEILVTYQNGQELRADAYNTMFCNDCPQSAWDSVDYNEIAAEYDALLAIGNGPRYWVLDSIDVSNNPSGERCADTIGGISMTYVATVIVDVDNALNPYYIPSFVERSTVYHFNEGREVYQLRSPTDSCYIMQSYTVMFDSSLTLETLPNLGQKLELPEGWSYSSHTLNSEFQLANPNGIATLISDELRNSYQYLDTGCLD